MHCYYRFPLKDPELTKRWVVATKREGFNPGKSTKLCSDHFKDNDYAGVPKQSYLKPDAIPSVFTFPAHLMV